jgi:voltage-gated potassium channel
MDLWNTGREPGFLGWRDRVENAVVRRRVFPYLVLATIALGLASGLVVTLVDRKDFPTFGIAVWWAIVTIATVGYGDVVPHTTWGRVVGSVVIVVGVTFLSFLIATVTSYFVAVEEARRKAEIEGGMADALRQIERRLEKIEAKLES